MDAFPPGGWDLDAYATFNDWAEELKLLDGRKILNKILSLLLDMHASLGKSLRPIEMDDTSDEAADDDDEPQLVAVSSSSKGKGPIRVQPKRSSAAVSQEHQAIEATNDPKVRAPILPSKSYAKSPS
jgi:hypothetical protein